MSRARFRSLFNATAKNMLPTALLLSVLCFAAALICSFSLKAEALFIAGGISALLLPLLLLKSFSHLFSKRESDFAAALPFTAKERYGASLASGALYCLAIWSVLAAFALCAFLFSAPSGRALAGALVLLLEQCTTLLFGCALVSFGAVMGGNLLSALCNALLLPGVLLFFELLSPTNRLLSYAYSSDFSKVYGIQSLPFVDGFFLEKKGIGILDLIPCLVCICFALLLLALTGGLYCKRKEEKAGFAHAEAFEDLVFTLIIWLPCLAICLFLLINDEIHSPAILTPLPLFTTGLLHLICLLIRSRLKPRRILRLASMTVFPLLLALLSALQFGIGALWLTDPIPAEDIVSVHTEQPLFSDVEGVEGLYELDRYKDHFNFMNETHLTSPEALALFEESVTPFRFSRWGGQPVIVTLKNGMKVTRVLNFNKLFECFVLEYGDPPPEEQ